MFTEYLGGRKSAMGLFAACLFCIGISAYGVTYTFTTIDVPSATSTECDGISGDQIAGTAFFSGTPNGQFILESGTFSQSLFELSGQVTGISDGTLIGYQQTDTSHPGVRSFVEVPGNSENDQYDQVNPCYALGIDGQNIVGMRDLSDDSASVPQIGFTYNLGTKVFTDLINPAIYPELVMPTARSGNLIVGYYTAPALGGAPGDAFIYDGVTWTTIADPQAAADSTFPKGVSGSLVVGSYTDPEGATHGFTYNSDAEVWTTVDDPAVSGSDTVITGVSGTDLVGSFKDGSGNTHGFYASASGATAPSPPPTPAPTPTPGPTPNPYLFEAINVPGGHDTSCTAVYGTTVVGSYFDSRKIEHGFVQTAGVFSTVNYPAPHGSPPFNTMVVGISGQTVFGAYYTGNFDTNSPNANPFLYDLKTRVYTSLSQLGTGLNFTSINGTQVLGYSPRPAFEFGEASVVYDFASQTTSDFTIPFSSGYHTIDSAAQVAVAVSGTSFVGWDVDNSGYTRGFLAQGSVEMPLDEPNAYSAGNTDNQGNEYAFDAPRLGTQPTAIDGTDVVGNYWDASLVQHGFLLDTNGGWTTIDCPLGNQTFTNVAGISNGEVVGSYQDSAGASHGFVAIPVGGAVSGTEAAFESTADIVAISGVITNVPRWPFNAATLLQLFGQPDVAPAQTRYYFDRDHSVVVLGSRDLTPAVAGKPRSPKVIYGEVLRYVSQSVSAIHRDGWVAVSGTCSMVNDQYSGTFTGWARNPAAHVGDQISITVPAAAGNSSVGIHAVLVDYP